MKPIRFIIIFLFIAFPFFCQFVHAGTITDIDGNVYQTVTIGTQVWMAQNLKVTHYRNGDSIPNESSAGVWAGLGTGAFCHYGNDSNYAATYGRLYNWFAATDARNIAPTGWHVPSDSEVKVLEIYLGMSPTAADELNWRGTTEGGKLKEAGLAHWANPNTGGNNTSGFSALPAGFRGYDGDFNGSLQAYALFWTTTEFVSYDNSSAYGRELMSGYAEINRGGFVKQNGFSIRCIKDYSCCTGKRGNVNGVGIVDLADLSALVGYLLTGNYVLPCPEAANINGVGIVDLSDLSALVSYLLIGSYVLPNCP